VAWDADTTPTSMAPATNVPVTVSFTNLGSLSWEATGANPYRFSYHWRGGACPGTSTAIWDGKRTALPATTGPGESVDDLVATVLTPSTAGAYCLVYDLLREGVTWFSWQGAATKKTTVTIGP
jgi:hypothetical protein